MVHLDMIVRRSLRSSDSFRALLAAGIAAGVLVGCGGTTLEGSHGGEVTSGGSGGAGTDAGSGGKGPGGGTAAGGQGGGSGGDGLGGSGTCGVACPTITCDPGYWMVRPTDCGCPSCATCAVVDCAPTRACAPGEQPVTLPGECCSSCGPVSPFIDGGVACTSAAAPTCDGNSFPQCAPDWATALAKTYHACGAGQLEGQRLEECGAYHVLVAQGVDSSARFFYDASGALVGEVDQSIVGRFCQAFVPSFAPPPDACVALPNCWAVDAGATGSLCGNGLVDAGEACDGTNLAGMTCASASMAAFVGGVLKCKSDCSAFDLSGCVH